MSGLRDAINMVRFGDPVRAIEAFNAGSEAARVAGFDDTPLDVPHDACYELQLPNGMTVRVLAAECADDDATIAAIMAVSEAVAQELDDDAD